MRVPLMPGQRGDWVRTLSYGYAQPQHDVTREKPKQPLGFAPPSPRPRDPRCDGCSELGTPCPDHRS